MNRRHFNKLIGGITVCSLAPVSLLAKQQNIDFIQIHALFESYYVDKGEFYDASPRSVEVQITNKLCCYYLEKEETVKRFLNRFPNIQFYSKKKKPWYNNRRDWERRKPSAYKTHRVVLSRDLGLLGMCIEGKDFDWKIEMVDAMYSEKERNKLWQI